MKAKQLLPVSGALLLFMLLALRPESARDGAVLGLRLCLELLIPSLLPFFAAANLLNRLGFAALLRPLTKPLSILLAVSEEGASVFLLGLTGGYPLGAAAAADLLRRGRIPREEAERLLFFCDNTGPAFALGAVGLGAFGSAGTGLFLYLVHAFTALLLGLLSRRGDALPSSRTVPETAELPSAAEAFTEAVHSAGSAVLKIGAFVTVFSALLSVLDSLGLLTFLSAFLALRTSRGMGWWRAAFCSLLELSSAAGALAGLPAAPDKLALAAFALSWGGLCVHCQCMAVTASAGLKTAKRLEGKLLQGVLSALIVYGLSAVFPL